MALADFSGSDGVPRESVAKHGVPASPGPIQFVVDQTPQEGSKIPVRIKNVGSVSYGYETFYAACYNVKFFDSTGREFKIPPGTHCDLLHEDVLRPGERVRLFGWKLDECVKDRWGCVRSESLEPGVYRLKGRFEARQNAGPTARPEIEIEITSAE
jgi:hypothetical protein